MDNKFGINGMSLALKERLDNQFKAYPLFLAQIKHNYDTMFYYSIERRKDELERMEARLSLPKLVQVGMLDVPSDGIFNVIDPCYIPDSLYQSALVYTEWQLWGLKQVPVYVMYDRNHRPQRIYVSGRTPMSRLGKRYKGHDYVHVFGDVGVDLGQVVIINEENVPEWKGGEYEFASIENAENHYDEACAITLDSLHLCGLLHSHGFENKNVAFASRTNWGDGGYPLWSRSSDFFIDFVCKFRDDELE